MNFTATFRDGRKTKRLRTSRVVAIQGLNFVLHRDWEGDGWAVSDLLSGAAIAWGPTQKRALAMAEEVASSHIAKTGDWRETIANGRKRVARMRANAEKNK